MLIESGKKNKNYLKLLIKINMKNLKPLTIELPPNSSEVVLLAIPSLEDLKLFRQTNAVYLEPETKKKMAEERRKADKVLPYYVAKVGEAVTHLKEGDCVFTNPDSMATATIIRFSQFKLWENPVMVHSMYCYRVIDPSEYIAHFEDVIETYLKEEAKAEASANAVNDLTREVLGGQQ